MFNFFIVLFCKSALDSPFGISVCLVICCFCFVKRTGGNVRFTELGAFCGSLKYVENFVCQILVVMLFSINITTDSALTEAVQGEREKRAGCRKLSWETRR